MKYKDMDRKHKTKKRRKTNSGAGNARRKTNSWILRLRSKVPKCAISCTGAFFDPVLRTLKHSATPSFKLSETGEFPEIARSRACNASLKVGWMPGSGCRKMAI